MDKNSLEALIEAILFYTAEPIEVEKLAKVTGESPSAVTASLEQLGQSLADRGIRLMRGESTVALATAPTAAPIIEKLQRDEYAQELGRAAFETLAIVLYQSPVTRSEIDYIRGVNSTFTLRNLLMRDLVERAENPQDKRSYVYQPTLALLGHLGVTAVKELPDFKTVKDALTAFEQERVADSHE